MSMTWEEIADSRLWEIRRLRTIIRRSTPDSFIVERAAGLYNKSKQAFCDSRAAKSDDVPLNGDEIKCRAEMEIIAGMVDDLGVMERGWFIKKAETFAKEKETGNEN